MNIFDAATSRLHARKCGMIVGRTKTGYFLQALDDKRDLDLQGYFPEDEVVSTMKMHKSRSEENSLWHLVINDYEKTMQISRFIIGNMATVTGMVSEWLTERLGKEESTTWSCYSNSVGDWICVHVQTDAMRKHDITAELYLVCDKE